jgi:hypothetical protein
LWGPGPTCHEHGGELTFKFGEDGFLFCGLFVDNEDLYKFTSAVLRGEASWTCRVPMSADRSFYLPLVLPLWGVSEESHLHINHHMAFVFHADQGRIIGAAAYPVRDRFQLVRMRSTLSMHGPVHWFAGHGYQPLQGGGGATDGHAHGGGGAAAAGRGGGGGGGEGGVGFFGLLLYCVSTCLFTLAFAAVLYVTRLKPMLAAKYLKRD